MLPILVDFDQYLKNTDAKMSNQDAAVAARIRDATVEEERRARQMYGWGYFGFFETEGRKLLVTYEDGMLLQPQPDIFELPPIAESSSCS